MLYTIKRTSIYDDKVSPCEKAFKAKHEYWHTRTCTEDEFNKRFSDREGMWRSKGKNHSTLNDGQYITRQEKDAELWSIEINSIEELMAFVAHNGEIIIKPEGYNTKSPEIEIYDDYRE